MRRLLRSLVMLTGLVPVPLAAQARDSGAFVVRLGDDTIAVERYVRTPSLLVIESVSRLPQTRRTRLIVQRGEDGRVLSYEYTNAPPTGGGGAREIVTTAEYRGDSIRVVVAQGANGPRIRTIAGARDMLPLISPIYSTHAVAITDARQHGDTILRLAGMQRPVFYRLRFAGDTAYLTGDGDAGVLKAALDDRGVAVLDGTGTTFKVIVTRADWFEPDSVARRFAEEDARGRALGVLSPRDTVRARISGAALTVAYGRPLMRGRTIFGALVPFDQVWRTGANAATELTTDRALVIEDDTIPAGRYSIWTIPGRERWILIINGQTGQWGTSYDPALDVARIEIPVEAVSVPAEQFTIDIVEEHNRGALRFTWDRTRAVAHFLVDRTDR